MTVRNLFSLAQTTYTKLSGKDNLRNIKNLRFKRLEICKQCPLFKKDSFFGNTIYKCDEKSYIDIIQKSDSEIIKKKRISGCGCTLDALNSILPEKTVLVGNETCPASKWNSIEKELFYIEEYTDDFLNINNLNLLDINESIDSEGITEFCNKRNLTLKIKPEISILKDLETQLDVSIDLYGFQNKVALRSSDDKIEYLTYSQLDNN